jgi:hypothetical protein
MIANPDNCRHKNRDLSGNKLPDNLPESLAYLGLIGNAGAGGQPPFSVGFSQVTKDLASGNRCPDFQTLDILARHMPIQTVNIFLRVI